MRRIALLTAVFLLVASPAQAHSTGFGLNFFGLPSVINNLVWGTLFTAIAIAALFALSRHAEARARRAAGPPNRPRWEEGRADRSSKRPRRAARA